MSSKIAFVLFLFGLLALATANWQDPRAMYNNVGVRMTQTPGNQGGACNCQCADGSTGVGTLGTFGNGNGGGDGRGSNPAGNGYGINGISANAKVAPLNKKTSRDSGFRY